MSKEVIDAKPLNGNISKDAQNTNDVQKTLKFTYRGIWTVMREVAHNGSQPELLGIFTTIYRNFLAYWRHQLDLFPYLYRFIKECIGVSPWMMVAYLFWTSWHGVYASIGIYVSHRLLQTIQDAVTSQHMSGSALRDTLVLQLGFGIVNYTINASMRDTIRLLESKVYFIFQERMMYANLRMDMPTYEGVTASKIQSHIGYGMEGNPYWGAFQTILRKLERATNLVSQICVLYLNLKTHPGGYAFALVCSARPIYSCFLGEGRRGSAAFFIWDSDPHHRRLSDLKRLVSEGSHRLGIISEGLADYVRTEWSESMRLFGNTPEDLRFMFSGGKTSSRLWGILDVALKELPLMFYAYQVYKSPKSFSLSTIVLVQQVSENLSYLLYAIFSNDKFTEGSFQLVQELYKLPNTPNKLLDGDLQYPINRHTDTSSGMEIKLENVSFSYPNSEPVIKNISFTIKKGQTVVIVGANGSGKSTLLKLINRIHDVNEGSISVDGTPLKSFTAASVRRSMAIMFQTFSHFPLSIRENLTIGLADAPEKLSKPKEDREKTDGEVSVEEAARLGGSVDIVNKQKDGFDAALKPSIMSFSMNTESCGKEFIDKMEEITKRPDLSSGQWQRLALSRLFYRAAGKHIKLVAADEPSASVDPQLEYELFRRLRALGSEQGKTLVYVTHRFGYLTKTADLILVMDDGQLVEQGSHSELVAKNGKYTKLYNLQAEAFLPDEKKS